jgi:hypothetical protein
VQNVSDLIRGTMAKLCPNCRTANVRRSGLYPGETHSRLFHSPYRCRVCKARFWVVSKLTRVVATAGGVALLVLLGVLGPVALTAQNGTRAKSVPAVVVVGESEIIMQERAATLEDLRGQVQSGARRMSDAWPGEPAPNR